MSSWVVLFFPLLVGQPAPTTSVDGSWTLALNIQGNTGTPTCSFKQDGAKLTGTCTAPNDKESPATGEVTDKKVTFRYDIEWEGSPLTLIFTGAIESESDMKGTIDVQPAGVAGDFTAKKGCGC
jgi:hypothetical protein